MNAIPLQLFNERVTRLHETQLGKKIAIPTFYISIEDILNGQWCQAAGINRDDVDAFVLNLRLIVQDKDGFSINCLSRIYQDNSSIPPKLCKRFADARSVLNKMLSGSSCISRGDIDNPTYTNQELFDIIMYGGLVHCNSKYLIDFNRLAKRGGISTMTFAMFISILKHIMLTATEIKRLNEEVLERLAHVPNMELSGADHNVFNTST